jgi:hypothetical protein
MQQRQSHRAVERLEQGLRRQRNEHRRFERDRLWRLEHERGTRRRCRHQRRKQSGRHERFWWSRSDHDERGRFNRRRSRRSLPNG